MKGGYNPQRCVLINTLSGEFKEPLFNPEQLKRSLTVRYQRHQVPSLPFEVLQYQGTSNMEIKGLEFYMDQLVADQKGAGPIRDFEAFLRAFCYPPQGVLGGLRRAPPRLLVVWPNVVTLACVMTDLEMKTTLFFEDGRPRVETAVCTLQAFHIDAQGLSSEEQRREL